MASPDYHRQQAEGHLERAKGEDGIGYHSLAAIGHALLALTPATPPAAPEADDAPH
jgi:hypothetical protein